MEQPNKKIELTPDTGAELYSSPHPNDPQQIKSGSPHSPGGEAAPTQSSSDMTHGGEGYPGPRSGGETAKTGETPHPDNVGEK